MNSNTEKGTKRKKQTENLETVEGNVKPKKVYPRVSLAERNKNQVILRMINISFFCLYIYFLSLKDFSKKR
jgi:hypothetical protein